MTVQKKLCAEIGAAIREHRKQKGISQADLAKLIGVSQPFVGAVERGEQNLTIETISRFAAALGKSVRVEME